MEDERLRQPAYLEALTRILFCADGLTRRTRVGGEDYHFRAAPSAGALYPIEIYAAVPKRTNSSRGFTISHRPTCACAGFGAATGAD